jgi:hypothetical protein
MHFGPLTRVVLPALVLTMGLAACAPVAPTADATTATSASTATAAVELGGIKDFLLAQSEALLADTADLQAASDRYFALAQQYNGDYSALWQGESAAVAAELAAARAAWIAASPAYERTEGIVAGTPSLAHFDVILDAGASGAEDPANAAPIDLTLADGRVLTRPGNLFGVAESTLWGTEPTYSAGVEADLDGDGAIQFSDSLPDANVLKAAADALHATAAELLAAAQTWQPSQTDAFTALVVMVPTMSEYFASWRDSRFVAGDASTQRDFVVISRLADVQDILSGLQVVYAELQPLATSANADQAVMVSAGLEDLKSFVADIATDEAEGRRFTPEEADILGAEAQNRATALTGQISQIAALLGIEIQE